MVLARHFEFAWTLATVGPVASHNSRASSPNGSLSRHTWEKHQTRLRRVVGERMWPRNRPDELRPVYTFVSTAASTYVTLVGGLCRDPKIQPEVFLTEVFGNPLGSGTSVPSRHGCPRRNSCFPRILTALTEVLGRDIRANDAGCPSQRLPLWADFSSLILGLHQTDGETDIRRSNRPNMWRWTTTILDQFEGFYRFPKFESKL